MSDHGQQPKSTPRNTIRDFAFSLNPSWSFEDWFHWPPDLFALTSLLLKSTGGYRFAANPPAVPWPESENWQGDVEEARAEWYKWILGYREILPDLLDRNKTILWEHWERTSLEQVGTISSLCHEWHLCKAILELHAVADSACAGFGLLLGNGGYAYLANMLLVVTGSLSRLPRHKVLVLPKMRTPGVGITLRSLSHHVTVHESEVEVVWRTMPWINSDENTVNILVIPWPFEVKPTWFQPEYHSIHRNSSGPSRYFKYKGNPAALPVGQILTMIKEAEESVNRVHMIVLPELALSEHELFELKNALVQEVQLKDRMPMLITGVRRDRTDPNAASEEPSAHQLDRNQVVLSIFFAGKWYDLRQDKHHRWKLDGRQIQQYNLGGALAGNLEWWEAIEIPRRRLTILSPNGWLALCPLICEDLARLEPVSELIRGIGPTLLIAILLDGPQLRERWPGRYASVLADDPGTSVLTVTSLGMAKRSLAGNRRGDTPQKVNRTVALWKDDTRGWEEIELAEDEHAVLLTVAASWEEEHTADGRSDGRNAARFVLQGYHRLKMPETSKNEPTHPLFELEKPLDVLDLTRFSYLADAMIDADVDTIENLRHWALGEIGEEGDWTGGPFPQKASVWQIIESTSGCHHAQSESGSQTSLELTKQTLGVHIDWLVHLVRSAQITFEPDKITYWGKLVKVAKEVFDDLRDGTYLTKLENDTVLARIIQQHGGVLENKPRVKILSALAILWGVHTRLAQCRREGRLTPPGTDLVRTIEEILPQDYQAILRPAPQRAMAAGG